MMEGQEKKCFVEPECEEVISNEECQGAWRITKAVFFLCLLLFVTCSLLVVTDYRKDDHLSLRQMVLELPSVPPQLASCMFLPLGEVLSQVGNIVLSLVERWVEKVVELGGRVWSWGERVGGVM